MVRLWPAQKNMFFSSLAGKLSQPIPASPVKLYTYRNIYTRIPAPRATTRDLKFLRAPCHMQWLRPTLTRPKTPPLYNISRLPDVPWSHAPPKFATANTTQNATLCKERTKALGWSRRCVSTRRYCKATQKRPSRHQKRPKDSTTQARVPLTFDRWQGPVPKIPKRDTEAHPSPIYQTKSCGR